MCSQQQGQKHDPGDRDTSSSYLNSKLTGRTQQLHPATNPDELQGAASSQSSVRVLGLKPQVQEAKKSRAQGQIQSKQHELTGQHSSGGAKGRGLSDPLPTKSISSFTLAKRKHFLIASRLELQCHRNCTANRMEVLTLSSWQQ